LRVASFVWWRLLVGVTSPHQFDATCLNHVQPQANILQQALIHLLSVYPFYYLLHPLHSLPIFVITISVALFWIFLHVVPMALCIKTLSFTCNSLRCCGTIKCGNWGMLYLLSHHFISKYLHLSYICSFCLTQSLYSIAQQHLYIFTCVSVLQTLAHISVSLHTF